MGSIKAIVQQTTVAINQPTHKLFVRPIGTINTGGGGGASAMADLTDVLFADLEVGDVPKWDGTQFVNAPDQTGGGGAVSWGDVTGKPSTFPPSAHNHTASEITDFDDAVANNPAVQANTAKVSNASHTGEVTGDTVLTIADLAVTFGKMQNVQPGRILGHQNAGVGSIEQLTPTEARTILNVADGATANSSDAALRDRTTHTGEQAIATVTGLQTALDGKQATSQKDAAGGYAGLDGSGKINPAQLPSIAITDRFVLGSQAAMLALTAETGDIAIRTDLLKTFMLSGDPTVLANWQELLTPTDAVQSVFGRSGTVTAQSGDYTTAQVTESGNLYFTEARVRTTPLAGYSVAASRIAIADADTMLGAWNKVGKWLADLVPIAFSGSASDLSAGTVPAARMPAHTGDATSPSGSVALTLATVNGNVGSFGLAGSVAQFVVNAKGLITSAANVAISIASTAISDSTAAGRAMLTAATVAAQTALLDTFTSALKGLVPASGGGTTNFLRADGTWAAPAGGGGASFPDLFEYSTDCYSAVADQVCQAYTSNGTTGIVAWPFAGNPLGSGFMRLALNAAASGRAAWGSANIANALYLRQGESKYQTGASFITLSDGTNSYETNLGFMNDFTAAPTYGCYFRYNHAVNGGRWEAVTVAGGAPTVADTGVAAAIDNMTIFGITVNAAGTSVVFTIDGTTVATITTTIPAAGINLGFGNAIRRLTGSGAVLAFLQDYIRCTQEFTGR